MAKSDRVKLVLTLEVPAGATLADAVRYVRAAVISHRGGLDPEDPMFHLRPESVTVVRLPAAQEQGA